MVEPIDRVAGVRHARVTAVRRFLHALSPHNAISRHSCASARPLPIPHRQDLAVDRELDALRGGLLEGIIESSCRLLLRYGRRSSSSFIDAV